MFGPGHVVRLLRKVCQVSQRFAGGVLGICGEIGARQGGGSALGSLGSLGILPALRSRMHGLDRRGEVLEWSNRAAC